MTLSERKFIFHARAVIYNGQQASMFALFKFRFLLLLLFFFFTGRFPISGRIKSTEQKVNW